MLLFVYLHVRDYFSFPGLRAHLLRWCLLIWCSAVRRGASGQYPLPRASRNAAEVRRLTSQMSPWGRALPSRSISAGESRSK